MQEDRSPRCPLPGAPAPGTLGLFGYALDDLGFFQMDLPEARATPPMTALISVLDGRTASPAIISEELRHLFNPDWDWEVSPISDREFTVSFPDPVSLRYGTHSARLTLALNQLSVRSAVPSVDPLAGATLSTVWVQIRGLPAPARDEGVLRGLSRMLGKFVAVDCASLPKGPAVRVQIKSPDPAKLKTTIRMFFNDVGYDLRISVEGGTPTDPLNPEAGGGAAPGSDGGANAPGSPRDPHRRSPRSEASDDDSSDPEDDGPPAGSSHPSTTHSVGQGAFEAETSDDCEDITAIAAMLDEAASSPLAPLSLHPSCL